MDIWIYGYMDGYMDVWMYGWIYGWMDIYMDTSFLSELEKRNKKDLCNVDKKNQ